VLERLDRGVGIALADGHAAGANEHGEVFPLRAGEICRFEAANSPAAQK